jgi:hypothetical protein
MGNAKDACLVYEVLCSWAKASLNGEFHRPGFQDVKLWYEIDVSSMHSFIAQFHRLKGSHNLSLIVWFNCIVAW